MTSEIILNHAKSLATGTKDFNFDKLEVAVTLPTKSMIIDSKKQFKPKDLSQEPFMKLQVNPLL